MPARRGIRVRAAAYPPDVAEAERAGVRLAVADDNNFSSDPVGLSEYALSRVVIGG